MLVQITKTTGRIDRVRRGQTPIVELDLQPTQYVIGIELREAHFDDLERKTVDWYWTAYIATPLGNPA